MALTWEDREVKFDLPYSEMRSISGEKVIDRLDNIEDTKGNNGDKGRLIITNLRILWHSIVNPRISLSVGYSCILAINTKIVNSKLRGTTQALHILTSSNGTRFEFIFTNLIPGNMRHFTSVIGVYKAYSTSKLYRELKLRGALIHNKKLIKLPMEQIFNTLRGVWNLSSDQGSPGTFIITNVRLVWFADMNEGFNISLPYLRIDNIRIRDSKFGKALVITCIEEVGGYIFGFRIDPEEQLHVVFKELDSLHIVYANTPIYGVDYELTINLEPNNSQKFLEDYTEIEETQAEICNTLLVYMADEKEKDRPPEYCTDLGLSLETIKDGYNLQTLWDVIPLK